MGAVQARPAHRPCLVDEGQDTNADQWRIVEALTEEFFAGRGARAEALEEEELRQRTQFAVGDYKQAIFGFQGTDPEEFRAARDRAGAGQGGRASLPARAAQPLVSVSACRPDRGRQGDRAEGRGGLRHGGADIPAHKPHREGQAGAVTLWPKLGTDENPLEPREAENKVRALAVRIAGEVRGWLDERRFVPSRGRAVQPQDILILLRSRGDLVPELVAALHARGVPVAGADRLRLTAPLAVKDCLSLIRFAFSRRTTCPWASCSSPPFSAGRRTISTSLPSRGRATATGGRRKSLWFALRIQAVSPGGGRGAGMAGHGARHG